MRALVSPIQAREDPTMDPKSTISYFAPSVSGASAGAHAVQFPSVERQPNHDGDGNLVTPETREEVLRGELIYAMPALPPQLNDGIKLRGKPLPKTLALTPTTVPVLNIVLIALLL